MSGNNRPSGFIQYFENLGQLRDIVGKLILISFGTYFEEALIRRREVVYAALR